MALFTAVIATGNATPMVTGFAAVVIGTSISVNSPNVQVIVPLLVPKKHLINAVALQNGAGQAAGFGASSWVGWQSNCSTMLAGSRSSPC